MDAFWTAKLIEKCPVDAVRYERIATGKLTKYSLSEIQESFDLWVVAHNEYVHAYHDLWFAIELIVPKEDQYVGWQRHAPEPAASFLAVDLEIYDETPPIGNNPNEKRKAHHSSECYPLTRWNSETAKYRRATKKIRASLRKSN